MSKQLLVFDIDDVLADTTEALREFVNSEYGYSLQKHHYNIRSEYWGYYEAVWSRHDINGDGILDKFHTKSAGGYIQIDPMTGSQSAVAELAERFDLAAVSSRSAIQQRQTELWIGKVYGGVFKEVRCIDSRHTGMSKGSVCDELGASYLVDDNTEHCKSAKQSGIVPILFGNYGWQDEATSQTYIRCINWQEVMEYFNASS